MNVGLVIPDLTHLRYFVPLAKKLRKIGEEPVFLYDLKSNKYNGLANSKNFKRFQDILISNKFCSEQIGNQQLDVVFTVEFYDIANLSFKKHFAIQHGLDCTKHGEMLQKTAATYLTNSQQMSEYLHHYSSNEVQILPLPVVLWDSDLKIVDNIGSKKSATVFYPERGMHALARKIIDGLEHAGVECFVKQRKKHQAIPEDIRNIVYDEMWYPSESIMLPLCTNVTVGFGSTAYTDLVYGGVEYVNIDFDPNNYPWNVFFHPKESNYHRLTLDQDVVRIVTDIGLTAPKPTKPLVIDEQICSFLVQLLHGS